MVNTDVAANLRQRARPGDWDFFLGRLYKLTLCGKRWIGRIGFGERLTKRFSPCRRTPGQNADTNSQREPSSHNCY